MGKGILAVGFPDSSHIQPGSQLSQRVEEDKAKLRQLIYLCDEVVYHPYHQTFQNFMKVEGKNFNRFDQHGNHLDGTYNTEGTGKSSSANQHPPRQVSRDYQPQHPQNLKKWLYFGVSVGIGCLCILCAYIMLKS